MTAHSSAVWRSITVLMPTFSSAISGVALLILILIACAAP